MSVRETSKEAVQKLADKFSSLSLSDIANRNEEETKKDFILPLFKALGWETENSKEVSAEEVISKKRVDYGFRINGIPKFFLEAKASRESLETEHAKQAVNYSWLKSTTWAILTNFRELKVYNAEWKSKSPNEKLFFQLVFDEYAQKFDKLWLLSKESFLTDALDQTAEEWGKKQKKVPISPVTTQLFDDLITWRQLLTRDITSKKVNRNTLRTDEDIDESVQRILDRLIFIRVCEDKELEPFTLRSQLREWKGGRKGKTFYALLTDVFRRFDGDYNSKLFFEHKSDKLEISDLILNKIIPRLYENYEGLNYDFSAIDADVLGTIYEDYLGFILKKRKKESGVVASYAQRKKMGIYYTPTYVVDFIVENTVGSISDAQLRSNSFAILDPACGSGSFLLRALVECIQRIGSKTFDENISILQKCIFGVDLDPKAVEIAQLNLLLKILERRKILPVLEGNLKIGNSLVENRSVDVRAFDWKAEFSGIFRRGGFDIVIGNPPYVDSEQMSKTEPELRRYYSDSGMYSSARGNWDLFCLFLERGLQLLKEGGILGMIVPNKLLSAEYALATRNLLLNQTILAIRDYSTVGVFSASVYPVVIIVRKTPSGGNNFVRLERAYEDGKVVRVEKIKEVQQAILSKTPSWSPAFGEGDVSLLDRIRSGARPLGEVSRVSGAATVAEAYIMKPMLREQSERKLGGRFVNTGTVDRYSTRWGIEKTRYLGMSFVHPGIPWEELKTSLPRRAKQAAEAKLILAGMVKRLECFLDEEGNYIAGKSTTIVAEAKSDSLKILCALLNSKLLTYYYRNMFKSLALSGGWMRVGPPQITQLPVRFPSKEKSKVMLSLVDRIIQLNEELADVGELSDRGRETRRKISETDDEIDKTIYELYQMRENEVQVIERSLVEISSN